MASPWWDAHGILLIELSSDKQQSPLPVPIGAIKTMAKIRDFRTNRIHPFWLPATFTCLQASKTNARRKVIYRTKR